MCLLWHLLLRLQLLLHYRVGLLLKLALTTARRVLCMLLVLHMRGEHVWICARDRTLVARVGRLTLNGRLLLWLLLLLLLSHMMMELELLHVAEGLLGSVGERDAGRSGRDVLLQRRLLLIQLLLLLCSVLLLLCW